MSWQTLGPQIKTLLDSAAVFEETSATLKIKFKGYPAAYVAPSDQEASYETTSENERIYAFEIAMFYSTKSLGVADAITRLMATVDAILDSIDLDANKGAATRVIGVSLPSGYTWINTFAAPSSWGEVDGENLLFARMNIQIKVSRDIT